MLDKYQRKGLQKKQKNEYKGKINKWLDYYSKEIPIIILQEIDKNGNAIVSLDLRGLKVENTQSFLGNETKDAIEIQRSEYQSGTTEFIELAASKTVYAYQTISGHVSALKNDYRDV